MKKLALGSLLVAALLQSCGDKPAAGTAAASGDNQYKQLYEKSVKIKDMHTAITAVQMILLTDSTNGLRDSLPELYAAVNNVQACFETVQGAIERHPEEEKFKTIKVLCLQEMGRLDEQFALLKELYETTNKPQYIAQIAMIQVATGNMKDAKETIDTILNKYDKSKDSLEVIIDEQNKQKVPVKAAAWNMKGVIYMQQKNIDKAKECFFKALESDPEFVMPKRYLEMIFARR